MTPKRYESRTSLIALILLGLLVICFILWAIGLGPSWLVPVFAVLNILGALFYYLNALR
jgi:hypothetical protein